MEAILTSLSVGLLATTGPCILPLYPGFLAYLSANQAAGRQIALFPGRVCLARRADHDACPRRADRTLVRIHWQRAHGHHPDC